MKKRNILILFLIAAICVFALVYVPKWQLLDKGITELKTRIELENKLRATLSQTLGGMLILIGLYFAWRRITATERALEVSKQGQITERFTRAIDQLGATNESGEKKLEIRLGGIYALERISRDSKEDHWQVMEVLTAYVRENAPWKPKANQVGENRVVKEEGTNKPPHPMDIPKVPADIQAILTVFGRRSLTYQPGEERELNLARTDLRGAHLHGAHLEGAILSGAHLEEADLAKAQLEAAFLPEAHLEGAILLGAHLEVAFLEGAHLEGAIMSTAHLEGAHLAKAQLEKTFLSRAQLEGAHLQGAHLEGAIMSAAHLEGAHLEGAILSGAHLEGAFLEGAILSRAHLEVAFLEGAIMSRAHLEGADLAKAQLEAAHLEGADLQRAQNLTIKQLSKVKTLYEAKLDPELEEQIKKDYPHLFNKP